jgi:hypothetical protein
VNDKIEFMPLTPVDGDPNALPERSFWNTLFGE